MARRIILVGDPTSHGGVVLTGSAIASVAGKPIARLGDQVSCPKHGVNAIVEGEDGNATKSLTAEVCVTGMR